MEAAVFARFKSSEVLEVYLEEQPTQWSVRDLAARLCVPVPTVLDSLGATENHAFAVALYDELRANQWPNPLTTGQGQAVELPEPYTLFHEAGVPPSDAPRDVFYYLSLGAEFGHIDPIDWPLPRMRLYVFWQGLVQPQLNAIRTGDPGRRAQCVAVHEPVASKTALAGLRRAVEKLESAIWSARERAVLYRAHIGLISNGRMVVDLAERARSGEGLTEDELAPMRATLRTLLGVFDDLEVRLLDHLEDDREVRDVAWNLVRMFDDGVEDHAEFQTVVQTILLNSTLADPDVLAELLGLLERAFAALAVSPVADHFAELHFCDLLYAACSQLPESARDLFSDLDDLVLADSAREDWRSILDGIRPKRARPSVLTLVATASSVSKKASSIISAGFNDRIIGWFLVRLHDRYGDPEIEGKSLAGILLRYVAYDCVQHHDSSTQMVFRPPGKVWSNEMKLAASKRATFAQVKLVLNDVSLTPEERGKRLAKLELNRGFMRTPRAIGFVVALNAVALLSVATKDHISTTQRAFGVLAGAGSIVQSAMKFEEYLYVRRTLEGKDKAGVAARLQRQRVASAIVGALALAQSIFALMDDVAAGRRQNIALDTVAIGGAFASSTGAILEALKVLARTAVFLGVVGNMIGIGVALYGIIKSITSRTPKHLLDSYVEFLEAPVEADGGDGPNLVVRRASTILNELKVAIAAAEGALQPFRAIVGAEWRSPLDGPPTYWKAKHLGFRQNEICALFDVNPAAVAPLFTGPDGGETA